MRPRLSLAISLICLITSPATLAQAVSSPSTTPIAAAERNAVIDRLGQQLKSHYVFPSVAAATGAALSAKAANGGYRDDATADAFAKALSVDLKTIGKDGHLRVEFAPGVDLPSGQPDVASQAKQLVQLRRAMASQSYGISRVQLLPGDVGYLDLRGFGPVEIVGKAFDAAISLLAGTQAIIIDLRQNGGGEPDAVTYLLSHFFAEGDARHLNDIYSRSTDKTREYWTDPAAAPRFTGPLYVLTSHDTFSGGEECAYDLQTQKRATLVGEATGGGANPGDYVSLGHGFIAFIPDSRAINPITRTNWEHVGVKPDIAVPAAAAMKTAYLAILADLLQKAGDPDEREALKDVVARVNSGAFQLPAFYPRR